MQLENILMRTASQQTSYFIAFLVVLLLLAAAKFLQLYMGINPCPLCILQRVVMGLLGILFLFGIAFCVNTIARFSFGLLGFLISLLGVVVSGRQVWLQHLPSTGLSSNCDVSLQYMLQALPFDQVLKNIFAGGSTCSQVEWQFLHLSLAEWSLISFVAFSVFALVQILRK